MTADDQIRAQAMLNELTAQRNLGWDNIARASAEIAVRDARIAELEKQVADLTPKEENGAG